MASRPEIQHSPSEGLKRSKRRLADVQRKVSDIQEKGVDRSAPAAGPGMRPGREPAGEGKARRLSNTARDFELVEGRSDDALGVKRARVKREEKANNNVGERKKGRSDVRPSDLAIPMVRERRLTTDDGRTSFHFSHDSINKTNREIIDEAGRANRPGAAKAHGRYIERSEAVAMDDEAKALAAANDTGLEPGVGEAAGVADAAVNDNTNDGAAVPKQELYFDRPVSRGFLRTYRAALGALLSDPEPDSRGEPTDLLHGLHHVPGGNLVPDPRQAEMLLRADEVSVVGRDGVGGPGLRRAGDGDNQAAGGRRGRVGPPPLAPVPRRLSKPADVDPIETRARNIQALAPANDPRTAEGQGAYIERQEALATQPDGTRVLFTNIDPDAGKRAEFWRLVEEHERDAEPDKMSFRTGDNPEFWARVATHAECPKDLAEKIVQADPTKVVRVTTDGNVAIRRFISKVEGWQEVGARRIGETSEDYRNRRATATANFHDGRGGRVQYRIIGELPHELDTRGRASLLKTFSAEFEKRRLPYVAVMHAPDHTNSDKNWHFHLVYYDRPCDKVTAQQAEEYAVEKSKREMRPVAADPAHIGVWDFTIKMRERKTDTWSYWDNHPYRQEKSKEVNRDQAWIETLRKSLAEITNNHLQEAGIERRVDERRHSEMGIHSDPQEHLGTRLANLEAMGIATPAGVSNEEKQWKATLSKLDRDLELRKNAADRQALKWLQQSENANLNDVQRRELRGSVTRWHQHRIEAEEHEAIATNIDEHVDRLMSRAKKVMETCRKHIEAIEAGSASKFQSSRHKHLEAKSKDAEAWLVDTTKQLEEEAAFSAESRRAAARERLVADGLEIDIERALLDARGRGVAKPIEEPLRAANDDAERRRNQVAQASRQEINAWAQRLYDEKRRLTRYGRKTGPVAANDEDRRIMASEEYGSVVVRLHAMRKNQDQLLADVVKAVGANPAAVVRQRVDGSEHYILIGTRPALADAFEQYRDDPAIAEARRQALIEQERIAEERRGRTTSDDQRVAAEGTREQVSPQPFDRSVEAPVERPVEDVPDEISAGRDEGASTRGEETRDRRVEETNNQRAEVGRNLAAEERIARAILDGARRVAVTNGIASLSEDDRRDVGADERTLASTSLQKRLVGIAATQDREIRRLTGYARSNPKRIVEIGGKPTVSPRAPREIVEIATRWSRDEDVARQLIDIRDKAAAPAPTRQDKRGATPPAAIERGRVAPMPRAATAPKAEAETSGKEPAAKPRSTRTTVQPPMGAIPSRAAVSELVPDNTLREEASRQAAERRRQQEADDRMRAAATPRPAPGGVTPDAGDGGSRAERAAARQTATNGAHPLIDQWMASTDPARLAERRQIAWQITNDRQAREKLRDIDRTIARRIREDSDIVRQDRQPSLGLGIEAGKGQGLTPERK